MTTGILRTNKLSFSKPNQTKPNQTMIDRFLTRVFKASKVVSAVFVLICLLTMAGAALYFLATGPDSVEAPKFEFQEDSQGGNSGDGYDNISERKEIEGKYGDDVLEVIKKYDFSEQAYDIFMEYIIACDPSNRKIMVKGWVRYLKDAARYIKKNEETTMEMSDAAMSYFDEFDYSVGRNSMNNLMNTGKRTASLITLAASLTIMLLFLILPLLILIEKNTRGISTSNNRASAGSETIEAEGDDLA